MGESKTECGIQIVLADEELNAIVTLGGAIWQTEAEARRHFDALPVASKAEPHLVADFLSGPDLGITEDKLIPYWAAEKVLGKPFAELRAEGIQRHRERGEPWPTEPVLNLEQGTNQ